MGLLDTVYLVFNEQCIFCADFNKRQKGAWHIFNFGTKIMDGISSNGGVADFPPLLVKHIISNGWWRLNWRRPDGAGGDQWECAGFLPEKLWQGG